MRIILSRKGVDSGTGRIASPILSGSLVSLPIPGRSQIAYDDLRFRDISVAKLASDLSHGRLRSNSQVHLDPDLRRSTYPRKPGWRPIFGQGEERSKSHLQARGVTVDDLFLFYGWFRRVKLRDDGRYHYEKGAPNMHVIFGWLQVGAIVSCDDSRLSRISWARYHPHFRDQYGTAYIARRNLELGEHRSGVPGAGYFTRYHECLRLSKPGQPNRRVWQLPRWFYPRERCFPITYHPDKASFHRHREYCYVESAARGQEFVLNTAEYREAISWARRIIMNATRAD
jgi:Nucleotide modification associated domain 3